MSRAMLNAILSEMKVWLNENELIAYFGLIGATSDCEAPEIAWKDPYNRHVTEEA